MADTENNKNSNSPALRFPGFSEPWKRIRLGDNCTIQMCKRIFANQTSEAGDVPFFKIGTIGSRPDAFISKELFDEYKTKYNYPIEGEVMITCAGTVGKTLQFDGSDSYFQDSNIVWIHNPNQLTINDFLAYILGKINWNKLNSTTITRIYNDDLRNLFYYAPENVAEQKNIVLLLRLIDERISTQRRLIDKLETLIKGVRDLFIRKTISDGKWVKLGDICHITTGKLDANAMEENGQYPFFTCAEKPFCINNYAFDTEALLISGNGANLGYINYYNGKFNAYQRTYVLDKFTEDIQFIKIALQMLLPKRIAIEKSTSNTPYIVQSTLSDMRIFIPSKDLQRRTTNLMLRLEEDMCVQTSLLASYNRMKSYLLQQMFI